jgi:hypothetical protein
METTFSLIKITPKDKYIISQFGYRAKFDQVLAAALGVKEAIFDENGRMRSGLRNCGLDLALFGATISFVPLQKNLFNNKAPEEKSIRFGDAKLIRLRDGEQHRISFNMYVADVPYKLVEFAEIIKKEPFTLTLTPASKQGEEDAAAEAINFGLFKKPKEVDDDDPAEAEDDDEKSDVEPAAADEPQELAGAALASWRQIHGRAPRVPPRESLKENAPAPEVQEEEPENGN